MQIWVEQAVLVVLLVQKRGHHCGGVMVPKHYVRRRSLVALPPPQEAPVVEHVFSQRVQRPVVSFSRISRLAGDLNEAVVQGEVVPDGVLPRWELLPVVLEAGHNELADAAQRELLLRRLQDRHGYERDVRIRRLDELGGALLLAVLLFRLLLQVRRTGSPEVQRTLGHVVLLVQQEVRVGPADQAAIIVHR